MPSNDTPIVGATGTVELKSDAQLVEEIRARNERKAKLVSVLDRSVAGDRLRVDLPDNVYGEWFPNDKLEIYRAEAMGFKVDEEFACKRALHDDGTGSKSIVGDVIFMTCPRETKELIDEIRKEQYEAINSPRGGRQKEERDFANNSELPTQMKSRVDSVNVEQIRAAITAKD